MPNEALGAGEERMIKKGFAYASAETHNVKA
jgi:hypothetical protein